MAVNGFFEGTTIPLDYVPEDQRARFEADIAEAGGDARKWQSTLYDIGQSAGDRGHSIHSGEYELNRSVGDRSKGSAGKTYAELATSGASGFTDTYGDVSGPEVGIPDVDIHGYPSDWTVKSVDGGQEITKPGYGTYFKPSGGGVDVDAGSPSGGGGVVNMELQPFALSTLTDDMDLSNAIAGLLDKNSPLFKAAGTAAMQRMAKRGIVNSSLAFGEVERSILDVAMPIAKAEIDNLIANMNKNTEWTNAERKQANDYVFSKMLKDIDNAAAYKLGLMKEDSALAQQKVAGLADIMAADKAKPDYWDEYMELLKNIG